MIEPEELERRVREAMPDAVVNIKDLTGGRDHYEIAVVSAEFAGMSALARHRKVYAIFDDVLGGALHALSIKTQTPDETA